MLRALSNSIFLLITLVVMTCVIYPLVLWGIGQTIFPFQANGSMVTGPDGKLIGSVLIAQPFTKAEYFQPRPSAASYDASASASSALAPSNYALRDRVARTLGPLVKYRDGKPVGPDIVKWFQQDTYQGQKHIVAQWAVLHSSQALAWVNADPTHQAYVDHWTKLHPANLPPTDLAVVFFQNFSKENPGKFLASVSHANKNGKSEMSVEIVNSGSDIQAIFFDMWRHEYPDADLQTVPGDFVTTSASGLDPHISLENAHFQLDRVAAAWASKLKRDSQTITTEIEAMLQENARAAFAGFAGERFVNVLQLNIELNKHYGAP